MKKKIVIILLSVTLALGFWAAVWDWFTDPCDTNAWRTGICK